MDVSCLNLKVIVLLIYFYLCELYSITEFSYWFDVYVYIYSYKLTEQLIFRHLFIIKPASPGVLVLNYTMNVVSA